MPVETLNETNENLIQKKLMELKDQIDNKPWQVKFLRESSDKKYNIYSYTLVQWGTKWWIKKKYTEQIWAWVEWTQFTNANWKELTKDKFNAWEVVYLRVPKNKESNNQAEIKKTPWKVEYLWNKKDKQNRNWKWYSYTFAQWWTVNWAMDKWYDQIWWKIGSRRLKYCDKDWNKLKKERFWKWETIYIKVPNTDIIDPTPEMTSNDIMNISKDVLNKLMYDDSYIHHCDKMWTYYIINGKKIYSDWWPTQNINNYVIKNKTFIDFEWWEWWSTTSVSLIKKVWTNYIWVRYDGYDIYRWNFVLSEDKYRRSVFAPDL